MGAIRIGGFVPFLALVAAACGGSSGGGTSPTPGAQTFCDNANFPDPLRPKRSLRQRNLHTDWNDLGDL